MGGVRGVREMRIVTGVTGAGTVHAQEIRFLRFIGIESLTRRDVFDGEVVTNNDVGDVCTTAVDEEPGR
jgi:hypothetical protein